MTTLDIYPMLNLILFGPPGSGKGTQSQYLVSKYNLIHLSTGDILRSEIQNNTPLGNEAQQIMNSGGLVGDDIVIKMIENKIDENTNANGFIFDGFPRTITQAEALDDVLQKKRTYISGMIALEVPNDILIERILLRGKDSGRPDDQNYEIIRNRIYEYNSKTLPLKNYYAAQHKFHAVKGVGSINSITNNLINTVQFIQNEQELTQLENEIENLNLTVKDFEPLNSNSNHKKQNKPTAVKTKKALKKTAQKLIKKAVVKKIASKKAVKKEVAKKVVKKIAPKKVLKKAVAKKVVKKIAPKKVLKKAVAKRVVKKIAPKKVLKKAVAKKITKKKNR